MVVFFLRVVASVFSAGVIAFALLALVVLFFVKDLPDVSGLEEVRYEMPLQVYSADNKLIAEYGSKRTAPIEFDEVPFLLVQAFVAAEDKRFFDHPGVDYEGLLRAAIALAKTGEKRQGGSTITMQVARNFFLSPEKSFVRKIKEILLALKIERELTKEAIMELYLNKIYLGHGAYGVKQAAYFYYDKPLDDLRLDQMAMLAGLPKAPSKYNPIKNKERALERRNYVLSNMLTERFVTDQEYALAVVQIDDSSAHNPVDDVARGAEYVAEMVRQELFSLYQSEEIYESGMRVYTTIDSKLQRAANQALRTGLVQYDRRHGYLGPEKTSSGSMSSAKELLKQARSYGEFEPAVVTQIDVEVAQALLQTGRFVSLDFDAVKWAKRNLGAPDRFSAMPKKISDVLSIGDLIRVYQGAEGKWLLAQLPKAEAAITAFRSTDGALLALSGGFDYFKSKFNRATQAMRQPGSSFKPFVYSAALENGYTLGSIVNDAPMVGVGDWRPENYSGKFYGPTILHEALMRSRNLVAIRILKDIGVETAFNHFDHFGLPTQRLPRALSISLGTGELTQYELASAYMPFSNGGYRVKPYFISKVEDYEGKLIYKHIPLVACSLEQSCDEVNVSKSNIKLAPKTVGDENLYLMRVAMRDVVKRGTAAKAGRAIPRNDIAGKTGTTNEQRDAWFTGFSPGLVVSSWVGFDDFTPLGKYETGGKAALPIWISFMKVALEGREDQGFPKPQTIVSGSVHKETGGLVSEGGFATYFEKGTLPAKHVEQTEGDWYGGVYEAPYGGVPGVNQGVYQGGDANSRPPSVPLGQESLF